jgi:polysaccharide deacetylase family protein (PEP-CTERM system associated)
MKKIKNENIFTVDVEDWFHILEHPAVPPIDRWDDLESRIEKNLHVLLKLFRETGTKSTFFWLGWAAERNKKLVKICVEEGHEIASHGYEHLLIMESENEKFKADILRSKHLLEDLTGLPVHGFRAAGFSITEKTQWAFEVIKEAGFKYDSSIFPKKHGHGGISGADLTPYIIPTGHGALVECPMSVVEIAGKRISFFGGGDLRLAPLWLIKWGVRNIQSHNRPLIVFVHPREIDPGHPKLPLGFRRRWGCYTNLHTTLKKIESLCRENKFITMGEYINRLPHRE